MAETTSDGERTAPRGDTAAGTGNSRGSLLESAREWGEGGKLRSATVGLVADIKRRFGR